MVKKKQKIIIIVSLIFLGILLGVGYAVYNNSKLLDISKQASKANSNQTINKTTEKQDQVQEPVKQDVQQDNTSNVKLTSEKATELIINLIRNKYPNAKYSYDHEQSRDGKNYYVIHVYDYMPDQQATNTIGWYYVQVDTGKAFEWDLIKDKLNPIN